MSKITEQKGILDGWRYRGMEVWRFNNCSLSEISQTQQADTNFSTLQPFNHSTKNHPTLTLPVRGGNPTDTDLSPYYPIALSSKNSHTSIPLALHTFRTAFTLAEVLITLGIVVVVSVMTMPVLITNVRNTELKSRFKKTTAELQNALQKVQFDEGQTIYGNYVSSNIAKVLVKQFKDPAVYHDQYEISNQNKLKGRDLIYKNYDNSDFNTRYLDDGTIIVNDNFFIFVNNDDYSRTKYQIYIDTNGFKKPNKEGYDLFKFCLQPNDRLDYTCDTYTQKAFSEKDYFKKLPR